MKQRLIRFIISAVLFAIGFLRIVDGDNILDSTAIHPESYNIAMKLLDELNYEKESI